MKRGAKAQISVEFITVFGFVFLMTIPLIIIFFDQSGNVQDAISENHLRNVGIKITDKAETVYYLGEPSQTTLRVYFPDNIEYINTTSRELVFGYITAKNVLHEIVILSEVNLTGSISTEPGIHYVKIESSGGGVLISG